MSVGLSMTLASPAIWAFSWPVAELYQRVPSLGVVGSAVIPTRVKGMLHRMVPAPAPAVGPMLIVVVEPAAPPVPMLIVLVLPDSVAPFPTPRIPAPVPAPKTELVPLIVIAPVKVCAPCSSASVPVASGTVSEFFLKVQWLVDDKKSYECACGHSGERGKASS